MICVLLCSGCNVFFGLDSLELDSGAINDTTPIDTPLVCEASCDCDRDCEIDCSGCDVLCSSGSQCNGTLSDGDVNCLGAAECVLGCADGGCTFSCTDRNTDCLIACDDAATCLLECGTSRPPPRRDDCRFTQCDDVTDCGDGVFVCNRACPS